MGIFNNKFDDGYESFEGFSTIEEIFSSKLEEKEQILWCGKKENKTTFKERGTKISGIIGPSIFTIFSVGMMLACIIGKSPGFVVLIPFVAVGVLMLKKSLELYKFYYAVTNKRVMGYDGKQYYLMRIEKIRWLSVTCSDRNIGSIVFNDRKAETMHRNSNTGAKHERTVDRCDGGIYGIQDPHEVEAILNKLIKYEPWH